MKLETAFIVLAMAAAAPAYAAENSGNIVKALANETGLTVRQVQMIVGNRTPFSEYRTSYSRSLAQFKRVLGKEFAEQLIAGETVVLERRPATRVAALDGPRVLEQMP